MKKVILAVVLTVSTSACGVISAPPPTSRGHILIDADEAGMRAFADMQNGLITNGKELAGVKSAAWAVREGQELQLTERAKVPGLMDKLFGGQ